jgi:hypothetical protein
MLIVKVFFLESRFRDFCFNDRPVTPWQVALPGEPSLSRVKAVEQCILHLYENIVGLFP